MTSISPATMMLAEIADKMPSTLEIITTGSFVSAACVAAALPNRSLAKAIFIVSLACGAILAWAAVREATAGDPFSAAVWAEMGGWWVAASILAPLAPGLALGVLTLLRGHSASA